MPVALKIYILHRFLLVQAPNVDAWNYYSSARTSGTTAIIKSNKVIPRDFLQYTDGFGTLKHRFLHRCHFITEHY